MMAVLSTPSVALAPVMPSMYPTYYAEMMRPNSIGTWRMLGASGVACLMSDSGDIAGMDLSEFCARIAIEYGGPLPEVLDSLALTEAVLILEGWGIHIPDDALRDIVAVDDLHFYTQQHPPSGA